MGLYVFSWPISLVMIERIYILYLIIIIESELWTITHCLGLGRETMVCAVCLSVFLRQNYTKMFSPWKYSVYSLCYVCKWQMVIYITYMYSFRYSNIAFSTWLAIFSWLQHTLSAQFRPTPALYFRYYGLLFSEYNQQRLSSRSFIYTGSIRDTWPWFIHNWQ